MKIELLSRRVAAHPNLSSTFGSLGAPGSPLDVGHAAAVLVVGLFVGLDPPGDRVGLPQRRRGLRRQPPLPVRRQALHLPRVSLGGRRGTLARGRALRGRDSILFGVLSLVFQVLMLEFQCCSKLLLFLKLSLLFKSAALPGGNLSEVYSCQEYIGTLVNSQHYDFETPEHCEHSYAHRISSQLPP